MGQPVKLSDALVLDARFAGEITERSIAGQIEFWAALGRAMDSLLRGKDVLALRKHGTTKSLAECLADIETPAGQQRVQAVLDARPFPHFEDAPDRLDWLVRVEADGTRTVGRFVEDQFVEEVAVAKA